MNCFKASLQKQTPEFPVSKNPNIKNILDIESLNKPFDVEEVKCRLKKLNKASGIDKLTSEMLKCSNYNLLNKLKKLFNLVSDSGYYLENWNHGIIYTIYKLGPKNDPSNYRGITLTSCFGKLFSTFLHVRIENEVEKKKLLAQSQACFRKNYRGQTI